VRCHGHATNVLCKGYVPCNGAERKWVINLESGNSKAEIGLVLRALETLNLRASLIDAGGPRTRGTRRGASRLDQVFQRLQEPFK
jgi:hypothetical protein